MRTNFLNRPRKSRKPQLRAGRSCLVRESRVESRRRRLGQYHRRKVSFHPWAGHQESLPGSAQRKVWSRAGLGGSPHLGVLGMAAWHVKAWPTGIWAPSGWHLPFQAIPFWFGSCRGVISEGCWLSWRGKSHGKGWMGPVGPLLQGNGFGLFTDLLVRDQHVSGWGFCFLSNHMLSTGGSQQVSHAEFKALAPHCLASWGVEIHDFH